MSRLVFVLLDGLATTARRHMSYMAALTESGAARHTELMAELPPLSRPLYATLLTGLTPLETGIIRNADARPSPVPTLFSRAREAGLTTAAAAYHWMSELCNRAPFEPARDRLCDDARLPISHGLFYSEDAYPDAELFRDAEALRLKFAPDLLLVHSMGIDFAGHAHGAGSRAYREAVRGADSLLAAALPRWLAWGATVMVTSDHGMDADASHADPSDAARRVPFWLAGAPADVPLPGRQTDIAGLAAGLLGLAPA
ncbi:MAG: alkaline phosphatase family protein [Desulfovibrio sp.]|uniref:alkaline phosphatase family protein n=1 Tax=Desulfovibrio sp. TaxID=885 RepID=UPI001A6AE306|nr:alkaline phosphatase family protein [Desulfovibrio sp.]MBD5417754.1 alkaline phosphatase family protein [Desulfovibrio sp.]